MPPISIFLVPRFILSVLDDDIDGARIDGLGLGSTFRQIVLTLARLALNFRLVIQS